MKDAIDLLDVSLLRQMLMSPRAGLREYARVLGVARGTVHSRVARMERDGVIAGYQPQVSPRGLGYPDLAYVRLNLAQGVLDDVTQRLAQIPEVIQADSVAGDSDLLCQVVATGPENLEELIQQILAVPGVMRSRTEPVLRRRIPHRIQPLLESVEARLRGRG